MEDVATDADVTRRTLYRYFATKDDLVFDAVESLLEDWNRTQREVYETLSGIARHKLALFLERLTEVLEIQKPFLRLMGEFDFVYRDANDYHPDAERGAHFATVAHVTEDLLEEIFDQGEADGSLRFPMHRALLTPTITTVLWSLGQRVAIRDHHIKEEFGVEGIELVRTQIALILDALTHTEKRTV